MRQIGIVAPQFPPEIGGLQTYAHETVKELVRRGYPVTVLTCLHDGGEAEIPGARVLPFLSGMLDCDREQIVQLADDIDCWHVMNAAWSWVALHVSPVVLTIHGNDFLDPNPVCGYRLRERLHLPFGSRADFHFARWNTRRLLRRALPRLTHIIANSELTKSLFHERFPDCPVEVSVGYVGVDDRYFDGERSADPAKHGYRLITVARLSEPRKNVDHVLEALAAFKGDHLFVYTVVGEGEQKARLQALALDLGIASRVRFVGSLSPDDLAEAYRSHDLFVLTPFRSPNSVEGFGIAYLEASAAGTPVLASRHCGAAPYIAACGSGVVIDEPDVETIRKALQKFFAGEVSISSEDCRRCAERFRWSRIVDHTVTCYPTAKEDGL